jgi:hypothetical protein
LQKGRIIWRAFGGFVEPFKRIDWFLKSGLCSSESSGIDNWLNDLVGTLARRAETPVALEEDICERSEKRRPSTEVTTCTEDIHGEVDGYVQPFVVVCELLAHEYSSR